MPSFGRNPAGLSSSNPADVGDTADPGSSTSASKADHVHAIAADVAGWKALMVKFIQVGAGSSGASGAISVTFGTAFDATPTIVHAEAITNTDDEYIVKIKTKTAAGFTAVLIKKNVATASAGVNTSAEATHTHDIAVTNDTGSHDMSGHSTNHTFNSSGGGAYSIPSEAGASHLHTVTATTTITGTKTNGIAFTWLAVA